jgi:hypothetical protein
MTISNRQSQRCEDQSNEVIFYRAKGKEMTGGRIREEDFLIIEPAAPIRDRDLVLVKIQKGHEGAFFSVRRIGIVKRVDGSKTKRKEPPFALIALDVNIPPIYVYSKNELRRMNPLKIRGFSGMFD